MCVFVSVWNEANQKSESPASPRDSGDTRRKVNETSIIYASKLELGGRRGLEGFLEKKKNRLPFRTIPIPLVVPEAAGEGVLLIKGFYYTHTHTHLYLSLASTGFAGLNSVSFCSRQKGANAILHQQKPSITSIFGLSDWNQKKKTKQNKTSTKRSEREIEQMSKNTGNKEHSSRAA